MNIQKLLVLLAVVGCTGNALAADHSVLGKALTVKDPSAGVDPAKRSVSAQGKEASSPDMIVGDPTVVGPTGGGELQVSLNGTSGSAQTFALPQGTSPASGKPYWSASGTTGFVYADPAGEQGPVTSASIKRTPSGTVSVKVKISGKRGPTTLVPPDAGSDGCIALQLGAGDRYSLQFGADGTIKNSGAKLFSVKNPTLEGICVNLTTTTTTSTLPDPCLAGNGGCDPLTSCMNSGGDAVCGNCPVGYTGTGYTVCNDVNECAVAAGGCSMAAPCFNTPGTHTCGPCPGGYANSGTSLCSDVNECATSHGGCDALATCTNDPGTYDCGPCPGGYSGSGDTSCTDINECATASGGCDVANPCFNSPGTHNCGPCPGGYANSGTSLCNDVNECETNNGECDPLAACFNAAGTYDCGPCPGGYTGTGDTSCTDINECAVSAGGCNVANPCFNSPGTHNCGPCPGGYTNFGTAFCNDINECATSAGGCGAVINCMNTVGGFNCTP